MDQIYQLQRQIQELRNEINTISQVAGQLQRAESNNAAQLQRLQQNETVASHQLNTIQQLCNHLSQDINAISNVTQQVTSQMFNRPVSSGQFGAQSFGQPITGQYGAFTPTATSLYSPTQFGAYGAQFSPYMSAGTTQRFGQGLNIPDYAVAQHYTTGMNQFTPFTSSIFPSSNMNTMRSSFSPMASTSSLSSMMPSYTNQQQFGTSSLAGSSTYAPYVSSHISSLPGTGLLSSQTQLSTPQSQLQLSTPQNMAYSSF